MSFVMHDAHIPQLLHKLRVGRGCKCGKENPSNEKNTSLAWIPVLQAE